MSGDGFPLPGGMRGSSPRMRWAGGKAEKRGPW